MSYVEADPNKGKVFLIATGTKTPEQALELIEALVMETAKVYPEGSDGERVTKMMLTRTAREFARERRRV